MIAMLFAPPMSRHSKWAKIKRQKAVTDVRRGQRFTKLSRAIAVAAREGGADPDTNVRLRMAVDQALAENMPKENIQRAIDRATGAGGEALMESVTLEGYGPAGAAFFVEAVTDNRNRTVADIRKLLTDAGGSLGGAGSTQWMFERRGHILLADVTDLDVAELDAIDNGALDTERDEATLSILTSAENLRLATERLRAKGYRVETSEALLLPQTPLPLSPDAWTPMHELLEALEEHDDVVQVVTTAVPLDGAPS